MMKYLSRQNLCRGAAACLLLWMFAGQQSLSAQEDTSLPRDSVPATLPDNSHRMPLLLPAQPAAGSTGFSEELSGKLPTVPPAPSMPVVRFSLATTPIIPYYIDPSPRFRGDYRTEGDLLRLRNVVLWGTGGQTSLPGIGRLNEASLGYSQRIGDKLTFVLSMDAMKVNMSRISGPVFSTSGTLSYQASDRVAFNLFGTYAPGNTYGMTTHQYGATVQLDMSNRFGMEMGVQRYYDSMRGGWQTVPVAIPYYKFDKFKLGLDVGGILYEVLRNAVFEKKRGGGPTIGPPRFELPIK